METSRSSPGADGGSDGVSEGLVGMYAVELDTHTLAAQAALLPLRSGGGTSDVYALSIGTFMSRQSFVVTAVRLTEDTVDLEYEFTHPFDAPTDPAASPTAQNRADLGFAGRVLLLADVESATGNRYFSNRIVNTSLMVNADGYYSPAGLLAPGTTANTFPYRVLVDELIDGAGSRRGIDNGGEVTGNYGDDGWTRAELGEQHRGWTGYGVLHQGQSSRGQFSLDREEVGALFHFEIAILAKYNDPRGGLSGAEKRTNRLPPVDPDPGRFAYRMPHGALDVERVMFLQESRSFRADEESASTLAFRVTDWDARAVDTAFDDLAEDPVVTHVQVGASGIPSLAVCIPGVLGDVSTIDDWDVAATLLDDDTMYEGDPGPDSGIPGDALTFAKLVAKTAQTGQIAGDYTGLVRVADAGSGQAVPLDARTLLPLTSNRPEPVVYQVFAVRLRPAGFTGGWVQGVGAPDAVDDYPLANCISHIGSDVYVGGFFRGTIDFGGGKRTAQSSQAPMLIKLNASGEYVWDWTLADGGLAIVEQVCGDGAGGLYLAVTASGSENIDLGGGPRQPAQLDAFVVKLDEDAGYQWDYQIGGDDSDNARGIVANATGVLVGGVYRSDPLTLGDQSLNSIFDALWVARLEPDGTLRWGYLVDGFSTAGDDWTTGVALGSGDQAVFSCVAGGSLGYIDFGGGPQFTQNSEGFLVKLDDRDGEYIDARTFRSERGAFLNRVRSDASGNLYVMGSSNAPLDLGTGVLLPRTFFAAKYTPDLQYVWDFHPGDGQFPIYLDLAVSDNGEDIVLGGWLTGGVDFGGGLRSPGPSGSDAFIVMLDDVGRYRWDHVVGSDGDGATLLALDIDAFGDTLSAGHVVSTSDFEPGPGVTTVEVVEGAKPRMYILKDLGETGLW